MCLHKLLVNWKLEDGSSGEIGLQRFVVEVCLGGDKQGGLFYPLFYYNRGRLDDGKLRR